MTSHYKRVIALALAAVLLAALLWHFLPRSFQRAMGPDFDPAQIESVQVTLVGLNGTEKFDLTLQPDDPRVSDLLTLLDSHRYAALLRLPGSQRILLEYVVHLTFSQGTGDETEVHTLRFTGDRPLAFSGSDRSARGYQTSDSLEFQQEIVDLILAWSE